MVSLPLIFVTGVDIKGNNKKPESWLDKQIKELTNGSAAKEMAIGGLSGWAAGVVFAKVGKTAATALAGSLFLFQVMLKKIGQKQGYIQINWKKVNKDIEKARHKLDKTAKKEMPWFVEETRNFVNEYKYLVTGFAGGFLIGISLC